MNGVGCEEAADAPCCVPLEAAVAPALAVTSSFVACVSAVERVLQRSRNAVHLRSGAPIVGIAWSHSLARLKFLRVGCSSVETGHERCNKCEGLGNAVQCEQAFVQRHVANSGSYSRIFVKAVTGIKRAAKTSVVASAPAIWSIHSLQVFFLP